MSAQRGTEQRFVTSFLDNRPSRKSHIGWSGGSLAAVIEFVKFIGFVELRTPTRLASNLSN